MHQYLNKSLEALLRCMASTACPWRSSDVESCDYLSGIHQRFLFVNSAATIVEIKARIEAVIFSTLQHSLRRVVSNAIFCMNVLLQQNSAYLKVTLNLIKHVHVVFKNRCRAIDYKSSLINTMLLELLLVHWRPVIWWSCTTLRDINALKSTIVLMTTYSLFCFSKLFIALSVSSYYKSLLLLQQAAHKWRMNVWYLRGRFASNRQ